MLEFQTLSFSYTGNPLITGLSMQLREGDHLSVLGESGCGKSTLLKLIYGMLAPEAGKILFKGQEIPGPSRSLLPGTPDIKYLAQDFGLMPYATVSENVGRDLTNTNKPEKHRRVQQMLDLVGIANLADEKPVNISGGQQQRAALAMTLASAPRLILLDEPFSQIDAFHTSALRRSIFNHCRNNGVTCVVATHDGDDVLSFASKVLVMRHGYPSELHTPKELFNDPPDLYSASLIGEASLIPENFEGLGNAHPLVLLPHRIKIGSGPVPAIVVRSYYRGVDYLIEASAQGITLFISHSTSLESGSQIDVSLQ